MSSTAEKNVDLYVCPASFIISRVASSAATERQVPAGISADFYLCQ